MLPLPRPLHAPRILLAALFLLLAATALGCDPAEEADAAASRSTPPIALAPAVADPPSPTPPPAATASATPVPDPTAAPVLGDQAMVDRMVDGDTIDVVIDGEVRRVRFILVDTPEVHGRVDCYGPEASDFVKALLPAGSVVYLAS